MPKEETIELRHIRNTVGENYDSPKQNARSSLSSKVRTLLIRALGIPSLIHTMGTLEPNKTLNLDTGENGVTKLFSDGTYLYACIIAPLGRIVKIDLLTFTKVSTLTLAIDESNPSSIVSDGTYLYVGLKTSPGKIVKIDLLTFTKVSTLTLDINEDNIEDIVSDGSYIYAGLYIGFGLPGQIVKVDIPTFTKVSTLTLNAAEQDIFSLVYDGTFLYAGTYTNPGIIVKINLETFSRIDAITLDAGENYVLSMVEDGNYLYAGLITIPGKIVKIDLKEFKKINVVTFDVGDNSSYSLSISGLYLYSGINTSPARIAKIDISNFSYIGNILFSATENNCRCLITDGSYVYAGTYTTPGKIIRRYIYPLIDTRQKKIDFIYEQTHTGTYYTYPSNAAGVTITSAAGAYTKGNYTEIIPVDTILTQYYITGITISNMTVNTDYELDIATGAAAAEVIIATVSHMTDNTNLAYECIFHIPIKVSSNIRISARSSDGTGSLTSIVKMRYKL